MEEAELARQGETRKTAQKLTCTLQSGANDLDGKERNPRAVLVSSVAFQRRAHFYSASYFWDSQQSDMDMDATSKHSNFVDSYLASLAFPDWRALLGSSQCWALLLLLLLLVPVLEVLHHLGVPLLLLLRVVL